MNEDFLEQLGSLENRASKVLQDLQDLLAQLDSQEKEDLQEQQGKGVNVDRQDLQV